MDARGLSEPLNFLRFNLDEHIYIKLRGNREIFGRLQAYDQHMNLIMSEIIEKNRDVSEREMKLSFIRGDNIIHIASKANN